MNFFGSLTSSLTIHEWVKKKNVIVMVLIAVISFLVSFFLSACFLELNDYLQSKIADMLLAKRPDSFNHNIFQLILTFGRIFLHAIESTFILSWTIIPIYATYSTISQVFTAMSNPWDNVSLVDGLMILFSNIVKIWARPLITMSYVSCLLFCYSVSVTAAAAAPLLIFGISNVVTLSLTFFVGITGSIFYLYLFAPWILSVFKIVVEEGSYELEAIQKGEEVADAKIGLWGLLLNIVVYFVLVSWFKSYEMKSGTDLFSEIYSMLLIVETLVINKIDGTCILCETPNTPSLVESDIP